MEAWLWDATMTCAPLAATCMPQKPHDSKTTATQKHYQWEEPHIDKHGRRFEAN
jgi:hypothetical protein